MTDTPERPGLRGPVLLAVAVLFLATGATGLVYQVVWQRYLLNIFGSTIYSISTVLSAFMGGLALGSYLFGRFSQRSRSPLALYGILEILVGLFALAVPALLGLMDPLFAAAYRNFGSNFYLYSLVRFAFVFVVLLIPTTFMGGTLPLLARFLTPPGTKAGARVGLLYTLNTLGAVLGTFLAGFYLIRWFGVSRTVHIAAGLNILAGVLAVVLARAVARPEAAPPAPDPALSHARVSPAVRLVLIAYFISGFAALGLEVCWTRGLVFTFELLKNTTYAFSAMLATFLVGLTLGSAVGSHLIRRERNPFRTFSTLQILTGLASMASFFILIYFAYGLGDAWFHQYDHANADIRWTSAVALLFLRAGAVMALPTFCMGLAFPAAVAAVTGGSRAVGRDVGRLYAINTVGAILGAALTGFVLLPLLGIAVTILLLGAIQLLAGVALLHNAHRAADESAPPALTRHVWTGFAAVALIICFGHVFFRAERSLQPRSPFETEVFYKEGPMATVSVLENSLGYRTIMVDNVGVAGTEPMLLTDQKSLAHVPMLLLDAPKSALTVGFGSGGASFSYTLHPELERIDCVEITRTVIEAAPVLTDSHHNVVYYQQPVPDPFTRVTSEPLPLWNDGGRSGWFKSDPRFNIILDDARSYLRFTDHRYSIIATDCTDLRYKTNANLYDLEYFTLCRDRITPDGMVVVWMPLAGLSEDAFKVALRTFQVVFPDMEVFYMNNEPTHYILLLGAHGPITVNPATMRRRLKYDDVRLDLAEIHLEEPEKVLSCFITGREKLARILGEGPLNTEDFPYLEFESPRYGYGDRPILDNLDLLMRGLESPERLVREGTGDAEFTGNIQRYFASLPSIIEGHAHYRELRIEESAKSYLKARNLNSEDRSLTNLLDFPEVRRKVRGQPDNLWARYVLGRALALQDRVEEAVSEFNGLLSAFQQLSGADQAAQAAFAYESYLELAKLYEARDLPQQAERYRNDAARFRAQWGQ